jgi:hypothetical protein
MSWFPSPVGPRAAIRDLVAVFRHSSREQVIGASLALLSTIIVVILFFVDSKINTAPGPQLIYVESWSENRTDAEIIADQKTRQAEKKAAEAEKQRQFQRLEKQLGM